MTINGNFSYPTSYLPSSLPVGLNTQAYTSPLTSETATDAYGLPNSEATLDSTGLGQTSPNMLNLMQEMVSMVGMMVSMFTSQMQSSLGGSGGSLLSSLLDPTSSTSSDAALYGTQNPITGGIYTYYNQDDPTLDKLDSPSPSPAPSDGGDDGG